jgi:hypothetical protein
LLHFQPGFGRDKFLSQGSNRPVPFRAPTKQQFDGTTDQEKNQDREAHEKQEFRIQDSGFRIQDSGFRIQDSGFRRLGLKENGSEIKILSSIFFGILSHGIRANLHSATPELLQLLTSDLRIARRESVGKLP